MLSIEGLILFLMMMGLITYIAWGIGQIAGMHTVEWFNRKREITESDIYSDYIVFENKEGVTQLNDRYLAGETY